MIIINRNYHFIFSVEPLGFSRLFGCKSTKNIVGKFAQCKISWSLSSHSKVSQDTGSWCFLQVFVASVAAFLSGISSVVHFVLSSLDIDLILKEYNQNIQDSPATFDVTSYKAERDFLIFCGAMLLTAALAQLVASMLLVVLFGKALECVCCLKKPVRITTNPFESKTEVDKYWPGSVTPKLCL